ncbi:hypothetical protein VC273_12795 [Xanthomonas nasturtii]|uniref:hypothetical protein n=1 Tax=Xanthomonas TaxID=338 RepID=UPI0012905F73|nr:MULTISPECIES: hypothetical protein [Xanthomonas]MEA9556754.1 hypothetical protein [Xanthomonas nasturtii]
MDAKNLFNEIEKITTKLLPSVKLFRIRKANGILQLGFSNPSDFSAAVVAASGTNIKAGVTGTFLRGATFPSIDACVLELNLDHECKDTRLIFFLHELVQINFEKNLITPAQLEEYKEIINFFEPVLDTKSKDSFDQ